jgi:hypothetical protein
MNVGDPLSMLFPDLDHCVGRLLALIIDSDGTVTEAGNKDIPLDLVGS